MLDPKKNRVQFMPGTVGPFQTTWSWCRLRQRKQRIDQNEQPSWCRSLVHRKSIHWPVPAVQQSAREFQQTSISLIVGGVGTVALRTDLVALEGNAIPRSGHASCSLPEYEPVMQGYHAGPCALGNGSS